MLDHSRPPEVQQSPTAGPHDRGAAVTHRRSLSEHSRPYADVEPSLAVDRTGLTLHRMLEV